MAHAPDQPSPPAQIARGTAPAPVSSKQPWEEPKLVFIEPKLATHGSLQA